MLLPGHPEARMLENVLDTKHLLRAHPQKSRTLEPHTAVFQSQLHGALGILGSFYLLFLNCVPTCFPLTFRACVVDYK